MNTVFIKSSPREKVTSEYSLKSGLVVGPIYDKLKSGFRHTLDRLPCGPKKPSSAVKSFATLALAAYIADKGFERSRTKNRWTRKLKLSVPVSKRFSETVPVFEEGLRFLSGDIWEIEPRDKKVSLGAKAILNDDFAADAVCLFSGGTDSLTGAINLLKEGNRVVLVSHFAAGKEGNIQNGLFQELVNHFGEDKVRHVSLQVCTPRSREYSTRSRSFLFIAFALMAASAFGNEVPVYIPENGFVGMNVPLTGSRQGSYSTRTTHPNFLAKVLEGLAVAGINHPIINPFASRSKGEVLKSCEDMELLKKLLPQTISCAKSFSSRNIPSGKNGGYCYACLIRRAALHSIGEDKPDGHVHDAIGSPEILRDKKKSVDLKSILQAVTRYKKSKRSVFFEILKTGSVSKDIKPSNLTHPVEAGFEELIDLISAKGHPAVQKYASLL